MIWYSSSSDEEFTGLEPIPNSHAGKREMSMEAREIAGFWMTAPVLGDRSALCVAMSYKHRFCIVISAACTVLLT